MLANPKLRFGLSGCKARGGLGLWGEEGVRV